MALFSINIKSKSKNIKGEYLMSKIIGNVSLWFASNEEGKIITIDKSEYGEKYTCPLCGSEVIPKAKDSECVSPHFAHIDRSRCQGETIIHWWIKNELLKQGDRFKIDGIEYEVKDIHIEKENETKEGIYKPDITIETADNKTIYFEINFKNKKNKNDYYKMWNELNNIVVEVNVMDYLQIDGSFNTDYNFRSIDYTISSYYMSEYKKICSKINKQEYDKETLRKLEWFIYDCCQYNLKKIDIDEIYGEFKELYLLNDDNIKNFICKNIWKSKKCNPCLIDIIQKRDKKLFGECDSTETMHKYKLVIDKLFKHEFYIKRYDITINITDYDVINLDDVDKEIVLSNKYILDNDICNNCNIRSKFKCLILYNLKKYTIDNKEIYLLEDVLDNYEKQKEKICLLDKFSNIVVKDGFIEIYKYHRSRNFSGNILLCKSKVEDIVNNKFEWIDDKIRSGNRLYRKKYRR